MNWDNVEGNWRKIAGRVKQRWGKLTSEPMLVADGQREELVGRIQAAYGITREDAERHVETLQDTE